MERKTDQMPPMGFSSASFCRGLLHAMHVAEGRGAQDVVTDLIKSVDLEVLKRTAMHDDIDRDLISRYGIDVRAEWWK